MFRFSDLNNFGKSKKTKAPKVKAQIENNLNSPKFNIVFIKKKHKQKAKATKKSKIHLKILFLKVRSLKSKKNIPKVKNPPKNKNKKMLAWFDVSKSII